ncbi:MAG: hypothetical protein ABI315_14105 [Bacteroidia bacterium]
MQKRPQSVHRWRQTDSATIAWNYYQNGMHFFQPEVLFRTGDEGRSGYTVSEFPIIYYFVAVLWKLFGYSDFIYRMVNFSIFALGLFALFRILQRILKDDFWAIGISLLFFTSPVIVYYANNFITDVSAFSFALIGWNYFLKYQANTKQKYFYYSFLFFTLAGLLKVITLISPIAILGIYLLETLKLKKFSTSITGFKLTFKIFITYIISFAAIFSWYYFAIEYNKLHKTAFFLIETLPIWDLSLDQIKDVWVHIKERWMNDYFSISVLFLCFVAFVWSTIKMKKQNEFLFFITWFIFIGVLAYIILWYTNFGPHDYYIISAMVLLVFILILFSEFISNEYQTAFKSIIVKSLFSIFLLYNIYYAEKKLNDRYNGWVNEYVIYKDVHTITPYLRSIGISPTDKIISLPDPTPNYTLYLMGQPGWTDVVPNIDSLKIFKFISLGAKYIVITETEPLSRPYLKSYLNNKIGEYGTISIFKL